MLSFKPSIEECPDNKIRSYLISISAAFGASDLAPKKEALLVLCERIETDMLDTQIKKEVIETMKEMRELLPANVFSSETLIKATNQEEFRKMETTLDQHKFDLLELVIDELDNVEGVDTNNLKYSFKRCKKVYSGEPIIESDSEKNRLKELLKDELYKLQGKIKENELLRVFHLFDAWSSSFGARLYVDENNAVLVGE